MDGVGAPVPRHSSNKDRRSMAFRVNRAVCVIVIWMTAAPFPAAGAVIVLANRTPAEVRFSAGPVGGKPQPYVVPTRDLAVIPVTGTTEIFFGAGAEQRRYRVGPNGAYYFSDPRGVLVLNAIGFPHESWGAPERLTAPAGGAAPSRSSDPAQSPATRVVTVKILVDQKEPAVRAVWEKRLRGRIEATSQVLDHICRTTLKVVAVDEWQSDGSQTELQGLFREFERRVDSRPAQIAIGFTSQPTPVGPETRVGVTGAALRRHILMREQWSATEFDRVDILLHEFGHYFGAAHSPEPDSIMRPKFGDRPRNRAYLNRFDPVSALIMNLVAEDFFDRGVQRLSDLSPATRERLRDIYTELARALPDDPTPGDYLRLLAGSNLLPGKPRERLSDLAPAHRPGPPR
jgi:hypothetical protein